MIEVISLRNIGLMTWYKYMNYGTMLQVVALSNVLKDMGYKSQVINYRPRSMGDMPDVSFQAILKKAIQKVESRLFGYRVAASEEREHLFFLFAKQYLQETKPVNTMPELADLSNELDAIICGSDQIWAPTCFDDKYFLSFVRDEKKMVAYAPSIGLTKIENVFVAGKMKKLIGRFKHLSVREQQGAELIKNLCGYEVQVVLDPTLLYQANEWDRFTVNAKIPDDFKKKSYAICYFLGKSSKYENAVKSLEHKLSLPVYVIPVFQNQYSKGNVLPFEVGPAEFVQLIANAKYVMTDSFHGLAFSVTYNKPFTVFKRFSDDSKLDQNSRIYNLLDMLKLRTRLEDTISFRADKSLFICDFNEANDILAKRRKESQSFLCKAIQEAINTNTSKIFSVKELQLCCGCGACVPKCQVNAISVEINEDGFFEKRVDEEKCVRCRKCLEVCPFYHVSAMDLHQACTLVAYKAKYLKNGQRGKSSSGAVGADLAQVLYEKGYVVSGCAYDQQINQAKHVIIDSEKSILLEAIKGSKYIQSNTVDFFSVLENKKFKRLAFFGTPCQVAALDKVLCEKGLRNNAVLVDLICHGIPSYLLWDKYLNDCDAKVHVGTHPVVEFRSIKHAWRERALSLRGNGKLYIKNEKQDLFYSFFRPGLCYMRACYECPYRERSSADIRVGDFWGDAYLKDQTGVSMVIAVNNRGIDILSELPGKQIEHRLSEYWTVQHPYNHQEPVFRDELIEVLRNEEMNLDEIYKNYAKPYSTREKISIMLSGVKRFIGRE